MKRRTIACFDAAVPLAFAHACPMCKDSIASPGEANAAQSGSLPYAFNTSIYHHASRLLRDDRPGCVNLVRGIRSTDHTPKASLKSDQSSRGFEVQPSDSSPGETE